MKTRKIFFALLAMAVAFVSCKKDVDGPGDNGEPITMENLVVPANFEWETSVNMMLTVNVESTKAYQPKHRISVFKGDPETGGQKLISGSARSGEAFVANLGVPAHVETLYLVSEGPFGSYQKAEIQVTPGSVSHTFSDVKSKNMPTGGSFKNTQDGPDCDEGCDEYISGSGNYDLSEGKTYCIAESFEGKITFEHWNGGGTLRICGTATITNNQYLEGNSHIVLAEGGVLNSTKNFELNGGSFTVYQGAEVSIKNLDVGNQSEITIFEDATVTINKMDGWGTNAGLANYGYLQSGDDFACDFQLENYGTLELQDKFDFSGTSFQNFGNVTVSDKFQAYGNNSEIYNEGSIYVDNKFEFGQSCTLLNYGSIEVVENFDYYDNASLENNGSISAGKDCDISSNGDFINNCQFSSGEDISFSGQVNIVLNTGYLKATGKINFWNNQAIELYNSCMITADEMVMESDMIGNGDLNSVVITNDIDVWNSNDDFDGQIEVVTTTGELHGGGPENFINGAYVTTFEEAQNYLPVTACNPEGFGEPSIVDTDNDGVPDEIDDYPEDPLRAFNNYFPDEDSYATVAFEDLWPATGDYDFNDLVVAVFGNEVTNADDDLVDIYINFVVIAMGASLDNGFGFQLESITPDQLTSVSGMVLEQGYVDLNANGTEAGQTKAVVIVTESVNDIINRPGGAFFNTVQENPTGTSDTVQIVMNFAEPIDRDNFGPQTYNPFIIKNQERSFEIHLPYYPPTDLMDTGLFGTFEDASDPANGIYYVTQNNLPWGLLMLEPFDYPVENSEIIEAYNFFATWAESGGTQYPDWYLNEPGYRNQNEIYVPND